VSLREFALWGPGWQFHRAGTGAGVGRRVVTSPSVPAGEALVLDPAACLIIDRMQVTVMISTEDRDNFIRNLVTILAELCRTFAVLQPDGALHITSPFVTD
jgi:hypothetical protein